MEGKPRERTDNIIFFFFFFFFAGYLSIIQTYSFTQDTKYFVINLKSVYNNNHVPHFKF